jgi:hypothetical protein
VIEGTFWVFAGNVYLAGSMGEPLQAAGKLAAGGMKDMNN